MELSFIWVKSSISPLLVMIKTFTNQHLELFMNSRFVKLSVAALISIAISMSPLTVMAADPVPAGEPATAPAASPSTTPATPAQSKKAAQKKANAKANKKAKKDKKADKKAKKKSQKKAKNQETAAQQ